MRIAEGMDKVRPVDSCVSNKGCVTKCNPQAENNNKDLVSNWLNSSNFDDDTESIISTSTAISSSLADSEDMDSFAALSLQDEAVVPRNLGNTTNIASKVDLLQHIFNKDSSVQTVGNVHIENSSQVHIGNKTYITGPIYITNPSDPCMEMLLNNSATTLKVNPSSPSRKPKIPTAKEEEAVAEQEESNRDYAFLGNNIRRKVADEVLHIVDRRTWLAQKPMEPYNLIDGPVDLVIISHSATEMATTQADNVYLIRNIQCFHVESCRWNDIGYNFMIGCDGNVYQGRGWGVIGAHTRGYNSFSVGICFIGCFMKELPPAVSLKACQKIIQKGIDGGFIVPDYKLVAHCQCSPTESPGRALFEEIKTWEHFCADL